MAVLEDALEYGLGDVFGCGVLTGKLDEESKQRPMVPFEEFAERIKIAVANGQHQSVVGE